MSPLQKNGLNPFENRHVSNYYDLTQDEIDRLWKQVHEVKNFLDGKYQPAGYNIGVNIGRLACQTIDHVHIHVIRRVTGDMEDPTRGIRQIIPEKEKY